MKYSFFIVYFVTLTLLNNAQTITDIDGNLYHVVTIGTQTWMCEDLRTSKYCNGDTIMTTVPFDLDISLEFQPKYQWPVYLGDQNMLETYGRLYTWYTIKDSRNVCPTGWHVPSLTECNTLINYLGGEEIAGNKIKESGTEHWSSGNESDNSSGLTALPSGRRAENGVNIQITQYGYWWTVDEKGPGWAYYIKFIAIQPDVTINTAPERTGLAVRCVKDNYMDIPTDYKEEALICPNPVNKKLYLRNSNYANTMILIFDMQGKQLLNKQIDSNPIDVSNLKRGIYVVMLVFSEKAFITKFIKN